MEDQCLAERVIQPANFDELNPENVEEKIKNLGLFEDDYVSDDDTKDRVRLTGKGIDFRALKDGRDTEFEVKNQDEEEDNYDWEDENDKIDYEKIFRYRNIDMIGGGDVLTDTNNNEENESSENSNKTPFEMLKLKMFDISPDKDGGVLKRKLITGTGPSLTKGSRVRIHYNAYFELNDEPFDSTHLRNKTFEFKLGANTAVLGLEIGVATMKKHEKSQFIFEPAYFMGELGCEPRVPRNTPVLFEVEVISFVESNAYDEFENKSEEQRKKLTLNQMLLICNCLRELGNDNYRRMNYKEASKKYRKAIYLLDNTTVKTEEEEKEWKRIMLKLNLNMSQVCLKQQKPKKTIFYCKEVLYLDPENVKALFRYGSSLRLLQDFDRSRKFLLRAYKANPSCSEITKEIQLLDEMVSKYRALEKDLYQRMFSFSNEKSAINDVEKEMNSASKNEKTTADFFIEDKSSLENNKAFIEKKIKEFAENPYMQIYKIQPDLYSKEIIDYILNRARSMDLAVREIKGAKNVIHIVKK